MSEPCVHIPSEVIRDLHKEGFVHRQIWRDFYWVDPKMSNPAYIDRAKIYIEYEWIDNPKEFIVATNGVSEPLAKFTLDELPDMIDFLRALKRTIT